MIHSSLLLSGLLFSFSLLSASAETRQPNVVILYADDLGYGDLRCYNQDSKIPTPFLDKLASEGTRFTDGHSSSGICTPSRYALLTGKYHWRSFHDIVKAMGESVIEEKELTLPEMLQENGYNTACIGKWHLGWDWEGLRKADAPPLPENRNRYEYRHDHYDWSRPVGDGPLAHGFHYYFGDGVINFPPYTWIENDKVLDVPTVQMDTDRWEPLKEGNWESRPGPAVEDWDPYEVLPELTRRAVSYVEKQKDAEKPFFLYFAFPSPHAPIVPAKEFMGKSGAGAYGDFVVQTDWTAGQILQALDKAGLSENTIVIFSSDNGPESYAYGRYNKFQHWSSSPLRGSKRDIYEGGHRVPFLVKWPGKVKAGAVSEALISQIDIMKTVATATGAKLPAGQAYDSLDQLPVWLGEEDKVRTSHVHNTYNKRAVREGDWLLIDAKDGFENRRALAFEKRRGYQLDDNLATELYDLSSDLPQKSNLAAENPEKVAELQELLKEIRQKPKSAVR